jgi:DNA polymerase II small subunit/DNA polymerase delta subunit B
VVRGTGGRKGVARYAPSLSLAQIEQMEMETVTVQGLGNEILAGTKPHVREFWRDMGRTIGASNGRETEYIFVVYHLSGAVHGYPITEEELRSIGVQV